MNHSMYKRTFNPLAAGSIPARPTKKNKGFRYLRPETLVSFLAKLSQFEHFCAQNAYIAIWFLALLIFGCGGGGADGVMMPMGAQYSSTTTEWTLYGDSSAMMLGKVWKNECPSEPLTNYGIGGATISNFLTSPDKNVRQKVIWMIGGNDVQRDRSTDAIVEDYFKLLATYKAARVYCVSLSPSLKNTANNPQIEEINEYLKGMCGQGYVDSWALYSDGCLISDGLHHTEKYDRMIIQEILRLDAEAEK